MARSGARCPAPINRVSAESASLHPVSSTLLKLYFTLQLSRWRKCTFSWSANRQKRQKKKKKKRFTHSAGWSCASGGMASSAKRRAVGAGEEPEEERESGESEAEEEEDSEQSEEEVNEEVVVDFEAHTISDNDFNGVKKLMQQLFLKAHVNTSELTDLIIQQNHIGSVIRQAEVPDDSDDEDPDEVFGFISIVNLTERKGLECVEQVKELVLGQCEKFCSAAVLEQFERVLHDSSLTVGLLLSERFINVPPQIALPLYKQLLDEMADAQRTNKPSGRCHYCLLISKTCQETKKSVPARGPPKEELMFVNAEEEFFYEQAVAKFNYSVQEEADSCLSGRWSFHDVPMKPLRTVSLIPMDKMPDILHKLKEYLTV